MNAHMRSRFLVLLLTMTFCLSLDSIATAQQAPDPPATETTKDAGKKKDTEPTDAKPERRLIRIIGDTKLDVRQWPLLGKPDAKYVFVEMFDYTCPHCRDMHHEIDKAFKKFGEDLAIISLPVPLNTTCNNQIGRTETQHRDACTIANLAVVVWRLKPDKFREFHGWLFESTAARTAAVARARAVEIVTEEALQTALAKEVPQKFIASHVKLYAKAGRGSIPKMLFPNITLVGNVGSVRLCETIERELGKP